MEKVNINSLIMDFNLYPRCKVDSVHASYMLESINAGVQLPAIIVDKKTKKVVDGFHRITSFRQYFKSHKDVEPIVDVIFKSYKSDAAMFADAMKYNSSHGRMLTQYDRAHCIILAEEMKLTREEITFALSITASKYDELKAEHIGSLHKSPHLNIPLKRTIRHKAGQKLTKKQAEVNERLSGMNQMFYANQIIDLIESDLLDTENEKLMNRLEVLHKLLEGIFQLVEE